MAKYDLLYKCFERAIQYVFKDEYRWTDFLNTQANIYKYDFKESILIYEQKYDATACATFDIWNKIGRTIKRNSKGIALLDEQNKIKYIWDVSSTIGEEKTLPKLWIFSKDKHFIHNLFNDFGIINAEKDLRQSFTNIISDRIDVGFENDFFELSENEPEVEKIKETYKINLCESVKYCVFKRCNIDYNPQFDNISVFGRSYELAFNFGNNVNRYSQAMLRDIEKSIRRSKNAKQERNSGDIGKWDSIREGRTRTLDTKLGNARRESHYIGEIRNASQRVFEEVQANDIRQTFFDGKYMQSLQGSGGTSQRAKGIDNGSVGKTTHKTSQERFYDDGSIQLHDKRYGRRNSTEKDSLQLQLNIFDFVNQETKVVENKTVTSAFSPTVEQRFENAHQGILSANNKSTSLNFNKAMFLKNQQIENYSITNLDIVAKGIKTKFRGNIEAIKQLKEIEDNNIVITKEHQIVLAKYVGWGGIPQAFDENNNKWNKEYTELKEILTEDEYKQARSSVLNAHYTSSTVIEAIYSKLIDMGFSKGSILEPSMGIGDFFGLLPESMKESSLFGVELDSITGRIAQKLYPKASIKVCGFEKTLFNDNTFDVAIGNVPFGNYSVYDKEYNDKNYKIHDYFFMKSLDKIRPGGIIAFVTSTGTLDKQSTSFRQELARKAELLGAVRLPNNTFFKNAGTRVTTDIIFIQKREIAIENMPLWVNIGKNEDGISLNNYYIKNPQMLLGTMTYGSQYGNGNRDTELLPFENANLKKQLKTAMSHINGKIKENLLGAKIEYDIIDAKELIFNDIRNYSFVMYQEKLFFYKNGSLEKVNFQEKQISIIKDLINIRDCVREIIKLQMDHTVSDDEILNVQKRLNILYDNFIDKNMCRLTGGSCKKVFRDDSSYPLLRSLEEINDDKEFVKKAPIFYERTIVPKKPVEHCDTAHEALSISMLEKAKVDIAFMVKLTGLSEKIIINDLQKEIFEEPNTEKWIIADEYLSGNVRDKLKIAQVAAEKNKKFINNVEALLRNQPKDLEAAEIFVRLGSTWIPTDDIKCFIGELLELSYWSKKSLSVNYSEYTDVWGIAEKIKNGVLSREKYGTQRKTACEIIEDSLNLRDCRVYDTIEQDGKEKRVLNSKETMLAQEKQAFIDNEFKNWIFKEQDRRDRLVKYYNENFNCIKTRSYNGSNIELHDVNPEITLRMHQKNAVARGLYSGNKLLAHVVGAGKSFTMAAISQEKLRLGLSHKCMFAVPKHLTEQMASDILRLYPAANVLVATTDEFSSIKRKEFCAKIATGGYTTIIIAHSQLEKIPLSKEFQENVILKQLEEIGNGIIDLKNAKKEKFSIKQMEKMRKNLETKLEKLGDLSAKDNVINFEELGIDDLYIDEAHEFKNLMYITKMRNVGGLSNTSSKKAQDLFMKCSFINEKTNFQGLTFATGTPISNSIAELYTMQRYLQPQDLSNCKISHFDSWVSSFAQTKTALELNPTGQGYRMKTRLSNYHNLPELMKIFANIADVQTQEMLNLPVPKLKNGKVTTLVLKPTEMQKEIVKSFGDRAEKIHNKTVQAEEDNFLKITNEGRLLALDQRLINRNFEDFEGSKINVAASNIYDVWKKTKSDLATQLVFSDIGTPKENGQFNIYEDLKNKLISKGIPKEEIAFIHSAKTDEQKALLFSKVRKGKIRVLIGSTFKMGSGTNVQNKLIALHHLDVPWRPSDLEQREGRILRQGNNNEEVEIFKYVTEGTFDSYNYQIIENKQKFISQIMSNNSPARSMEEIDEKTLNYAEIKALATGNPRIKEKMEIDVRIAVLQQLQASYNSSKYRFENTIKHLPASISSIKEKISDFKMDFDFAEKSRNSEFLIEFDNYGNYDKRVEAGEIINTIKNQVVNCEARRIGKIRGFELLLTYDTWDNKHKVILKNKMEYIIEISDSASGTITRIENVIETIQKHIDKQEMILVNTVKELKLAEQEVSMPFEHSEELKNKIIKVTQLNAELSLDKPNEDREGVVVETEIDKQEEITER